MAAADRTLILPSNQQPCFEDIILLGMVCVGFFILLLLRLFELVHAPKLKLEPMDSGRQQA